MISWPNIVAENKWKMTGLGYVLKVELTKFDNCTGQGLAWNGNHSRCVYKRNLIQGITYTQIAEKLNRYRQAIQRFAGSDSHSLEIAGQ